MASTKYPVLRQTLIIVSFVALVGFFFALNLLIFIPQQQEAYHNKIFRVLHEVSEDFGRTATGRAEYFAKNRNRENTENNNNPLACDELKSNLLSSFETLKATRDTGKYQLTYAFKTDTITVSLNGAWSSAVSFPIADVLKPTVELLHKDIFDLLMLVKREKDNLNGEKNAQVRDRILYTFGELSAGYILPGDSLFKEQRSGQFSSITDIAIAGTGYKAFTLPFRFGDGELMLVGFVKERTYKLTTTTYPRPTLLWIVFLLTVFVLSLPLVKIYLSSRQERISTNDLRMLMVVFIAMPFLVVFIAATMLLYRHTSNQTTRHLRELHTTVQQNFRNEIDSVVLQLKEYDSLLSSPQFMCSRYESNKSILKSGADTTDFRDILFYPNRYKNLDDIFWVNKYGVQVGKWFFINEPITYLDVSSRDYFRRMRDGKAFSRSTDMFDVEPTISWATGKYSVNVLTRSNFQFSPGDSGQAIMIGLAASLHSVCNPVLPRGYNFCIFDENGRILFHSQTERSLHENVFDESNQNLDLRNAVLRKQRSLISDIRLFDRDAKALISPLTGMPRFYQLSYFNKREQNLFVFHISAFTLLCTSLTLFGILVLVVLYYFFGKRAQNRRFTSYDSAWLKPTENKQSFYQQNTIQQMGVMLAATIIFLLVYLCGEDQYWFLLQESMLLPFLIVSGYILHRSEYNAERKLAFRKESSLQEQKRNRRRIGAFFRRNQRVLFIYAFSLLFILFSLNYLQNSFQERKNRALPVACMALVCLSVPALVWYIRNVLPKPMKSLHRKLNRRTYLFNYSSLVFLTTFFISVVPAAGMFSFAMNEEKHMRIKAGQFEAAKKVEERTARLNDYFKTTKLGEHEESYKSRRKFTAQYGIYLLHDTLKQSRYKPRVTAENAVHSRFYQAVTRFLFLPKDHSDFFEDNDSYYWNEKKSSATKNIALVYKNESEPQEDAGLVIAREAEGGTIFTSAISYGGGLILVGVLAFFIFQFMLLQAIPRKLFLLDYFNYNSPNHNDQAWVNSYYNNLILTEEKKAILGTTNGPLTNEAISLKESEYTGNKREAEKILQIQHLLAPAYDTIWHKLRNEAKFVLYDFALDGFTNYRNIDILYALYEKGLITKKNQQLELMNYSFRSYLLGKAGTEEIIHLQREFSSGSSWKNLKNVFFALFFAIIIFLFATQQDVSNRILAIVSGLATLVPLLLKIFDRNMSSGGAKQAS